MFIKHFYPDYIINIFKFVKNIRDAKRLVEETQCYTEKDLNEVQGEH